MSQCKICGDFPLFPDRHRCSPVFEVLTVDGGWGDDPWQWAQKVHAYNAESAAEKFGDSYDCEGDYTIVQGTDLLVDVRDDRGNITRWSITGESVPSYTAYSVEMPTQPHSGDDA